MLNDEWVTVQVAEARKSHTDVTQAVVVRIEELLSGQFTERQLTPAELKDISIKLIAEMVSNAPEVDGKE